MIENFGRMLCPLILYNGSHQQQQQKKTTKVWASSGKAKLFIEVMYGQVLWGCRAGGPRPKYFLQKRMFLSSLTRFPAILSRFDNNIWGPKISNQLWFLFRNCALNLQNARKNS